MGYTTTFSGTINFSRPLTFAEVAEIHAYTKGRHDGDPMAPSIHCDFEVNSDATGLVWNGSEKTYEAIDWIQLICDDFLDEFGVLANGSLVANGESRGDVWRLDVKDNVVTRVEGRFEFAAN